MPFIERVIPVLPVRNLRKSIAFYQEALGFQVEWGGEKARGCKVVLEPRNRPWAFEMKVEDIDGHVLWLGTEPRDQVT
jgi:predicted lactoylglutathione lyase